jgi:hypothetical protein
MTVWRKSTGIDIIFPIPQLLERLTGITPKQIIAKAVAGDDARWFLLSALNVKVKRFNQARVNSGSNCESLKVAECLVICLVTRMNGLTRLLLSLSASSETTAEGTGSAESARKRMSIEPIRAQIASNRTHYFTGEADGH